MNPTFKGETQFLAWGDGPQGPWIKLKLPDSDDLGPFRGMTQAKATMAGQRMACVLVEIGDDEKPVGDGVQRIPPKAEEGCDSSHPSQPKGGELAKLSGVLCSHPEFRLWLAGKFSARWWGVVSDHQDFKDEQIAAQVIRDVCQVKSRAELDHDGEAAERFHELIRRRWLEASK